MFIGLLILHGEYDVTSLLTLRRDDKMLDDTLMLAMTRLGFTILSEEYVQAVQSFMRGNNVFVNLPTGRGKVNLLLYFANLI